MVPRNPPPKTVATIYPAWWGVRAPQGLGEKMVKEGETDAAKIKAAMTARIESEPLARIDYVEIVDGLSMQPVDTVQSPALAAIAVYIGKTRLIDNFIV